MSSDTILYGEFVYREELASHPLTKRYAVPPPPLEARTDGVVAPGGAAALLAVDIVASLAAKAAESLVDAAAARLQAEAVALEVTIPLEGFYRADGGIAVDQGCLVFRDGVDPGATCSIEAVLQVDVAQDASAFRFTVRRWRRSGFLRQTKSWLQSEGERDFAIKIELLTPGADGLGTRSVFVEHVFTSVDVDELGLLFAPGQKLPWFAVPRRPAPIAGLANSSKVMPLNLRVTVIETTKPNQFAQWIQALAKEKKTEISTLVKEAVRQAIDPSFAASQVAKQADSAGTAYAAYKSAWDDLSAHRTAKPKLADNATPDQKAAHEAAVAAWAATFSVKAHTLEAKKVVAKVAFDAAELPWPGGLPEIAAS